MFLNAASLPEQKQIPIPEYLHCKQPQNNRFLPWSASVSTCHTHLASVFSHHTDGCAGPLAVFAAVETAVSQLEYLVCLFLSSIIP